MWHKTEDSEGKCPRCSSKDIHWGEYTVDDNVIIYPATCNKCETKFEQNCWINYNYTNYEVKEETTITTLVVEYEANIEDVIVIIAPDIEKLQKKVKEVAEFNIRDWLKDDRREVFAEVTLSSHVNNFQHEGSVHVGGWSLYKIAPEVEEVE